MAFSVLVGRVTLTAFGLRWISKHCNCTLIEMKRLPYDALNKIKKVTLQHLEYSNLLSVVRILIKETEQFHIWR